MRGSWLPNTPIFITSHNVGYAKLFNYLDKLCLHVMGTNTGRMRVCKDTKPIPVQWFNCCVLFRPRHIESGSNFIVEKLPDRLFIGTGDRKNLCDIVLLWKTENQDVRYTLHNIARSNVIYEPVVDVENTVHWNRNELNILDYLHYDWMLPEELDVKPPNILYITTELPMGVSVKKVYKLDDKQELAGYLGISTSKEVPIVLDGQLPDRLPFIPNVHTVKPAKDVFFNKGDSIIDDKYCIYHVIADKETKSNH